MDLTVRRGVEVRGSESVSCHSLATREFAKQHGGWAEALPHLQSEPQYKIILPALRSPGPTTILGSQR